jgi:hypothetical protein
MLTGKELLELVASKPEGTTKQELAIAAGYKSKKGRAQLVKYYEAYMAARGLEVPPPTSRKRGRPSSQPSSSVLHSHKTGNVVVTKSWWQAIDVGLEDQIAISIDRESPEAQAVGPRIILHKLAAGAGDRTDWTQVLSDETETVANVPNSHEPIAAEPMFAEAAR